MAFGPILLFDKSTLQSLNIDAAVWLDNFFRTNITPVFFAEVLGDLEKTDPIGRRPDDVVGNLAKKTPIRGSLLNVFHAELCFANLIGETVSMDKRFPVYSGGIAYEHNGRRGEGFRWHQQ